MLWRKITLGCADGSRCGVEQASCSLLTRPHPCPPLHVMHTHTPGCARSSATFCSTLLPSVIVKSITASGGSCNITPVPAAWTLSGGLPPLPAGGGGGPGGGRGIAACFSPTSRPSASPGSGCTACMALTR